jgi:hypothetical protein
MAKQRPNRHPLLIYYRIAERMRTPPLLTAALVGLLYGLAWARSFGLLAGANTALLARLWAGRRLLLALIGLTLLLYLLIAVIGGRSYVEVDSDVLRVRAGLIRVVLSYSRVKQIRPVQVGRQYPPGSLRPGQRALLAPYLDQVATAVILRSWPDLPLHTLWHKFMFTGTKDGLLFIVEKPMVLNQQLDTAVTAKQSDKQGSRYKDPIERAFEMQRKSRR